jgi:hypothetical protein
VGNEDDGIVDDVDYAELRAVHDSLCIVCPNLRSESLHDPLYENGTRWKNGMYSLMSRICSGLKLADREVDFLLAELHTIDALESGLPRNCRDLRKAELEAMIGVQYTVLECPVPSPRTPAPANRLMVEHKKYEMICYDILECAEQLLSYDEHRYDYLCIF